ncbi:MAG: hypothetical protein HUJ68_10780 [Clostridia bacterium]|nr:hypothetical protein [Clostridia bacterium]
MDIVNYFEASRPDLKKLAKKVYTKELVEDIKTKPETEQECFKYQYEYFTAENQEQKSEAWKKLFTTLLSYTKSLILQKLKNKVFLPEEEVYEKSLQAATAFLSCYTINYNFFVGASFAGYLKYKIIEVLYRPKNDDRTLSLDFSYENSSDKDYNFIDNQVRSEVETLWGEAYEDPALNVYTQTPYEVLQEVLDDYKEVIGNNVLLLKSLMYLELCLKKPKNRHIKEQYLKNIAKSKKELNAIEMLELEFLKRLKANYC